MKLLNTFLLQCVIAITAFLAFPVERSAAATTTGSDQSSDPGWPRERYQNGTRLIIYQPQVDDWKNFQDLSWRMAVSLTPKSGKEVVGVVEMKGNTDIDNVAKVAVITTQWPLYFDNTNSSYYLAVGQQWLTTNNLDGQWSPTKKLPQEMSKVAQDKQWSDLKKMIPPPAKSGGATPAVFYSDKPSEVILFDGQPVYAQIPDTQLEYATNTNSVVFVFTPTQQFYYLTAGRWFSAMDLQGPWTYATPDLPADFAKIPLNSPASAILASVPGTDEAKDAVLLAQVPTTMTVKPAEAQAKVKVEYGGDPKFEPIKGTSMAYATNTQDKVIKVGDVYYLCLQGVWFMSPNPQGPWTTAKSVPQEIYTIPPSSPVYNVTYVTQSTNPDGTVQASYTAGYLGACVLGAATGAIIANGSGYWWPPYAYGAYYPYPATYGGYYGAGYGYHYATPYYNYATGAYGWKQTASGPYRS